MHPITHTFSPIPLLKNTSNSTTTINNLQQAPLTLLNNLSLPPLNPAINPFGIINNANYSNNNNNTNNHIISQQSLLSPITPITDASSTSHTNKNNNTPQLAYTSPLYDSNNNNTNDTNIICDESAVHEIKLTLIHNPTHPTAPKYRWSANIQSFNGPLSNKLIQTLTNTTFNTNLHTNSERMDFCVDFTDKRLSWLLPFDADIPSISTLNPKPNNNNNYTSEPDAFPIAYTPDPSPAAITPPDIHNDNDNALTPLKKYKYSDTCKEAGYCSQCDKQFDGYRGLTAHRNHKHNKRNCNGPLSERYIQEQCMELDTCSDSDSDLSSSYMPSPSHSHKRKRKRIPLAIASSNSHKKMRLVEDFSDSCGEMDTFSDEAPMRPIRLTSINFADSMNAEKKRLFDKCVKHKVKYLCGNTQWSAYCGGTGLHKTPRHWCRYCGTRVSKRWYQSHRICSKHMYEWKKHETFKLSASTPFIASKNAEFSYLKQFVQDLDNYNDDEEEEDEEEEEEKDIDTDFDVCKIHSKKVLFGEKDGNKLVYYLVEWSGYDLKEANWEPAENLDCDQILNEFEEKMSDGNMADCVDCKIGGYLCYTKPCFKHHFELKEYEKVFVDYERMEIRQLAQRKVTREKVKSYCNRMGYRCD